MEIADTLRDAQATELLASEYTYRLPSLVDGDPTGLNALKFRRDKKLAHPEAINVTDIPPITYKQIHDLLSFAKDFIATVGHSYLNRMSNDIRVAGLLSWHGYALQAAAVVADCHESAFTVLYVGSDDQLAQRWIGHNDPTVMPFGSIKDLTRQALENLKVSDVEGQTAREYITYRQLCWAKHANPICRSGTASDHRQIKLL